VGGQSKWSTKLMTPCEHDWCQPCAPSPLPFQHPVSGPERIDCAFTRISPHEGTIVNLRGLCVESDSPWLGQAFLGCCLCDSCCSSFSPPYLPTVPGFSSSQYGQVGTACDSESSGTAAAADRFLGTSWRSPAGNATFRLQQLCSPPTRFCCFKLRACCSTYTHLPSSRAIAICRNAGTVTGTNPVETSEFW